MTRTARDTLEPIDHWLMEDFNEILFHFLPAWILRIQLAVY